MPDASHKLWLLEVNKCPTMEYSTHVTKALVPRFLDELADLILQTKNRPERVHGFELIYKSPLIKQPQEVQEKDKNLQVVGAGAFLCSSSNQISKSQKRK